MQVAPISAFIVICDSEHKISLKSRLFTT